MLKGYQIVSNQCYTGCLPLKLVHCIIHNGTVYFFLNIELGMYRVCLQSWSAPEVPQSEAIQCKTYTYLPQIDKPTRRRRHQSIGKFAKQHPTAGFWCIFQFEKRFFGLKMAAKTLHANTMPAASAVSHSQPRPLRFNEDETTVNRRIEFALMFFLFKTAVFLFMTSVKIVIMKRRCCHAYQRMIPQHFYILLR